MFITDYAMYTGNKIIYNTDNKHVHRTGMANHSANEIPRKEFMVFDAFERHVNHARREISDKMKVLASMWSFQPLIGIYEYMYENSITEQ